MKIMIAFVSVSFFTLSVAPIAAETVPAASPSTASLRAPSPVAGAQDTIPAGTIITMQNWRQYKQFMPDGMVALFDGTYFWRMPADVQMEIGPTIIHPLPEGYQEATEKFASQVRLVHELDGENGLAGYQGGRPFPNPAGPDKGWEILANLWFRYLPHSLVDTYGEGCLQNSYGNIDCSADEIVYHQLNYNTDPGIPAGNPGADGKYFTEWVSLSTSAEREARSQSKSNKPTASL